MNDHHRGDPGLLARGPGDLARLGANLLDELRGAGLLLGAFGFGRQRRGGGDRRGGLGRASFHRLRAIARFSGHRLVDLTSKRRRSARHTHIGWQEWRDSNPRPSVLETDALPAELHSFTANEQRAGDGCPPARRLIAGAGSFTSGCSPTQAWARDHPCPQNALSAARSTRWPASMKTPQNRAPARTTISSRASRRGRPPSLKARHRQYETARPKPIPDRARLSARG